MNIYMNTTTLTYLLIPAGLCLAIYPLIYAQDTKKHLALYPRSMKLFPNFLLWQFTHNSWKHLLTNLSGLVIYCIINYYSFGYINYATSFIVITLLSSLLTYTTARKDTAHVGASGLIFGLAVQAILLNAIIFSPMHLALSLMSLILYVSLGFCLLNTAFKVSYEAHWAGAVSGVISSLWLAGIIQV